MKEGPAQYHHMPRYDMKYTLVNSVLQPKLLATLLDLLPNVMFLEIHAFARQFNEKP